MSQRRFFFFFQSKKKLSLMGYLEYYYVGSSGNTKKKVKVWKLEILRIFFFFAHFEFYAEKLVKVGRSYCSTMVLHFSQLLAMRYRVLFVNGNQEGLLLSGRGILGPLIVFPANSRI